MGADDYITKPFSLLVLISKVHALMRRMDQKSEMTMQTEPEDLFGEYPCTARADESISRRRGVKSQQKELQLLCYFLEHPGQIISKEQILEAVWDIDGQFVDDNTVPVTISRLKKRLADRDRADCKKTTEKTDTEYIKNVRGLGYLWTMEVWTQ